jgi:hypothetical protein
MGQAEPEGGQPRSARDVERRSTRARMAVLVVLGGFTAGVVANAFRVEHFGIVVQGDEKERLVDFASHRGVACAAWSRDATRAGATSVYSLEAHLRATEAWTHHLRQVALPFAYSPTMLWILRPACLVSGRVAFAAWAVAGFLATAAVASRARLPWTAMLPLATPAALYTQALGQTAILTTAALLWLMAQDRERSVPPWRAGTVLWLLTAKPPLAITAACALVARRRWRPALVGAGLTTASTLAVLPFLGAGWVHDYLAMLGRYDTLHLPAAFAWSIVPATMSNLRAALAVDLGVRDDVAVQSCTAVWAVAIGAIVAAGWRGGASRGRVWALAVLAYLLLFPHVSATENVALACVLAVLGVPRTPAATAAVVAAVVGLWLAPGVDPPHWPRPSLLFFAMIFVTAVVGRDARLRESEGPA